MSLENEYRQIIVSILSECFLLPFTCNNPLKTIRVPAEVCDCIIEISSAGVLN